MVKRCRFSILIIAALALTFCFASTGMSAAPAGEPIVIGYAGMVLSPGTRPCMAIQKLAVQEINDAGGVLGRPLEYVIADNKGATSLTVEGTRRLLMENKAKFIFVEGRTEICLAAQENGAAMFKDYPHIMIFNGPMGMELTDRVLDEYEKYKFCFRDWDPEPSQYAQMRYFWGSSYHKMVPGIKKIAMLWEDLEWTKSYREGIASLGLAPWEEMMEKEFGYDVVYSKNVKPRGTMYLPLLQQIAMKKTDLIVYVSSWFTDTESFAKQWADSASRNLSCSVYGGISQTKDFWKLTGGKCMGIFGSYSECMIPLTEQNIPMVKKMQAHNIPTQQHVHLAYADIYFIKKAIETAGGVDDIDKLIKAMETTETTYSLGKMAYETTKKKPYFHSKIRVNPNSPYETYPGVFIQPLVQWQNDGKIAYVGGSCKENEELGKKIGMGKPEDHVIPGELRKMAK